MTREKLQNLPSHRQRHSLLTFGKNLLNIPDDPQEAARFNSTRTNKKRLMPNSGFSSPVTPGNTFKMARTLSDTSINNPQSSPLDFRFPLPKKTSILRRASSLMDLGNICEKERDRIKISPAGQRPTFRGISANSPTTQQLLRLRPVQQPVGPRALFKSPVNLTQQRSLLSPPSQGVSLLKRALSTSPQDLSIKPRIQIQKKVDRVPQMIKTVDMCSSNTVITLMPRQQLDENQPLNLHIGNRSDL